MSVTRHGPTPHFLRYATGHVLIPMTGNAPADLADHMEADALWLEIPNYQRGISWTVEQVEELLESKSVLLGNAVLGKFPRAQEKFPNLDAKATVYATLVDGLQRFSVATALLALLFPKVLREEPEKPDVVTFFSKLRKQAHGREVIFLHNDKQLLAHPRKAVSDAYLTFRDSMSLWLDSTLADTTGLSAVAENIGRLFIDRQIAVDVYSDFASPIELTFTFIGMNTVRVDLSPVDLMRAAIVERALSAKWPADEIEAFENRLTEVFAEGDRPERALLPFVGVINAAIEQKAGKLLFPSWDGALKSDEVSAFLDYVEEIDSFEDNSYLNEIRECGAIPYAGILAHYYPAFRDAKTLPKFLKGDAQNDELRAFLKATYRVLLDGRIGRTRKFAERALLNPFASLVHYADELSTTFFGKATSTPVDANWLRGRLQQADKNKAKRVFNAMRLPTQGGEPFQPDEFGRKAKCLHVDHLIPQKSATKNALGFGAIETLLNFAPLLASYNVVAKDTPCAEKLAPNGMYQKGNAALQVPHPYSSWLIQKQGGHGQMLDQQHRLEPNLQPDIPGERLEWMVGHLVARL